MKILGKESIAAVLFAAAAVSQTIAAPIEQHHKAENATNSTTEVPVAAAPVEEPAAPVEEKCISVHEQLRKMGATSFSNALLLRTLDFKYGKFTIFAPNNDMFNFYRLEAIYNESTAYDVALFHVSSRGIAKDIHKHCNRSLPMLNQELHVNQERSLTECSDDGKVYQVGPGNADGVRPLVGAGFKTCDGMVYSISDAIMLPTLPDGGAALQLATPTPNLRPTPAPVTMSSGTALPVPGTPTTPPPSAASLQRWSSTMGVTCAVVALFLLG